MGKREDLETTIREWQDILLELEIRGKHPKGFSKGQIPAIRGVISNYQKQLKGLDKLK